MSKKETGIFIFFLFMINTLPIEAKISLGVLKGIKDNSLVILSDQNHEVACVPYGIKPLETLKQEAKKQECTKSIDTFYTAHPHTRIFAHEHLSMYQTYHYEKIGDKCILYANGTESYSEMLLNEGVAIIDEAVQNKEWNPRLNRAAARGKKMTESLYTSGIEEQCVPKKR